MRYVPTLIMRAACALGICFLVALLASGRKEKTGKDASESRSAIAEDKPLAPTAPTTE